VCSVSPWWIHFFLSGDALNYACPLPNLQILPGCVATSMLGGF
jgi:hypothetical protein